MSHSQPLRWLAALLLLTLSVPAAADELRPGYLELTQQSERTWQVKLKAPIKGGMAANASPILPRTCTLSTPRRAVVEGSLISDWQADCAQTLVGAKVGLSGLDKTVSDALVRIAPQGRPVQAARLTAEFSLTEVAARAGATQVARTYFGLGVEHILTGYDHLLFVLSLVLLLSGGWVIARTVTAFTIAHSITLIVATLGFLGVSQKPLEICIALSILFLAVEVVKRDPNHPRLSERRPWLVAFLFGLLHGFGFAGALAEIGMPEGEVPVALLTFNLGVEVGQLGIVIGALILLALVGRVSVAALTPFKRASAYAIGITASVWFITRLWG
jgi:hydrogenase/urease accessory protein HupE